MLAALFAGLTTDNATDPVAVPDLPAQFDSEAELWQYITGFWEADGSVHLLLSKQLTLGGHQSNKAYVLGLKAVCGPEGACHRKKELDDDPGQIGLHSNGEPQQSIHYYNDHAIRLIHQMAPYVVTKRQRVFLGNMFFIFRHPRRHAVARAHSVHACPGGAPGKHLCMYFSGSGMLKLLCRTAYWQFCPPASWSPPFH